MESKYQLKPRTSSLEVMSMGYEKESSYYGDNENDPSYAEYVRDDPHTCQGLVHQLPPSTIKPLLPHNIVSSH